MNKNIKAGLITVGYCTLLALVVIAANVYSNSADIISAFLLIALFILWLFFDIKNQLK